MKTELWEFGLLDLIPEPGVKLTRGQAENRCNAAIILSHEFRTRVRIIADDSYSSLVAEFLSMGYTALKREKPILSQHEADNLRRAMSKDSEFPPLIAYNNRTEEFELYVMKVLPANDSIALFDEAMVA